MTKPNSPHLAGTGRSDVIKAELVVSSCSTAHLETQPPVPRSDLGGEPFGVRPRAGFAQGACGGRGCGAPGSSAGGGSHPTRHRVRGGFCRRSAGQRHWPGSPVFDEGTDPHGIALLLAGLIEAGSALGFTLVSVATGTEPATAPRLLTHPPAPSNAARPSGRARPFPNANPVAAPRLRPATRVQRLVTTDVELCDSSCRLAGSRDVPPRQGLDLRPGSEHAYEHGNWPKRVLERWVQIRLKARCGR